MIQIIEFQEAYPHYEYGFMSNNELTATEKLLGKKSCLTFDLEKKRVYQAYFLDDKMLQNLLAMFPIERQVKTFFINTKDGKKVNVTATRRNNAIYGVCLETHERVSFEKGFKVQFVQ